MGRKLFGQLLMGGLGFITGMNSAYSRAGTDDKEKFPEWFKSMKNWGAGDSKPGDSPSIKQDADKSPVDKPGADSLPAIGSGSDEQPAVRPANRTPIKKVPPPAMPKDVTATPPDTSAKIVGHDASGYDAAWDEESD